MDEYTFERFIKDSFDIELSDEQYDLIYQHLKFYEVRFYDEKYKVHIKDIYDWKDYIQFFWNFKISELDNDKLMYMIKKFKEAS